MTYESHMYEYSDDPFECLAKAVVVNAVKDFRTCLKSGKPLGDCTDEDSLRSFFRSDWFTVLCALDGKRLCRLIEEEVRNERKNIPLSAG